MDKLKALLKKLGASPEDVEAVEAEIVADQEAMVEGLQRKNRELIVTNKKLKASGGDDDGKVAELEAKIEELTGAIAAEKKAAAKIAQERDTFKAAAESERGAVSKLILEGGLTEALTKAGVRKELLPAARAYLKERGALSVKVDGEARKAVAMKDGKELDLESFVTEFVGTDEGKAYIPGGLNSGGGANPGSGSAGSKSMKRAAFEALDPAAKMEFSKGGGTLTE